MIRFHLNHAVLAGALAWSMTPAVGQTLAPSANAEGSVLQKSAQPATASDTNAPQAVGGQANETEQGQNRPNAQLSQSDRYRRHNNEWWYWNENRTWSYYRDGQWSKYDQNTYRRPAVVRYAPQPKTVYSQQPNQPAYRDPRNRTSASQPGYYQGRNSGQQRYYSGGQPQGYDGQPYGYGPQPYGYGPQPYGYGGQRYGTGYRGGYQRGYFPQSREARTGAAIGGIIGGNEGAAIGAAIGEASRD